MKALHGTDGDTICKAASMAVPSDDKSHGRPIAPQAAVRNARKFCEEPRTICETLPRASTAQHPAPACLAERCQRAETPASLLHQPYFLFNTGNWSHEGVEFSVKYGAEAEPPGSEEGILTQGPRLLSYFSEQKLFRAELQSIAQVTPTALKRISQR